MKDPKDNFFVDRIKSVSYALKGLIYLIKTENSIKVQLFVSILMTVLGFIFNITDLEWIVQILCTTLVLTAESLNTAVEKIANFIHPNYHEKIGVIKDVAAGAVAFAAIFSMIIGLIIYIPKFIA
jgi:diacylglycerol kinase (ATP)